MSNSQEPRSDNEFQEDLNTLHESSSDEEIVLKTSQPKPSTSQAQAIQQVYMPYIEGPQMDWTENDNLYHRFLKWKIKCEIILECELTMLPEARKCKKVIAWSGDFSLDQCITWNLLNEDLTLELIWKKIEEFCKPQTNELRARFDLLASFRQADMSVDEWYSAVQMQVALARYPPETAQILQRDIFWFFLKDESFVSKTLNEGHVELSKVRQMAKKLESSQTTAKHMRKVTKDPQATQVNLLRHQRTELPPSQFRRKQIKRYKSRQFLNKNYQEGKYRERRPQAKERFHKNPQEHTSFEDRCSKCGDATHIEGFRCPASRIQCKHCHKFGHFSKLCYKKKESEYNKNTRKPKAYQMTYGRLSTYESSISGHSSDSLFSEEEPFCFQMKVQERKGNASVPIPKHLVTNLEFKVKPHKRKTKFLRARVDTCEDVNLKPVSIHKKLFKDEDCTQIKPSILQLAT